MTLQEDTRRPTACRSDEDVVKPKLAPRSRKPAVNRSVARALALLLDAARSSKAQSFVEFQKRHKLPKATLHKLLITLETLEFLRRDEDTGKYSIGIAAMEVSAAGAASPGDLPNLLAPVLQKLVADSTETCHLGILVGGEEVILKRVDPPEQVVRLATLVGRRHPAHASAGGLASLALNVDEAIVATIPDSLPQLTKNTLKTREDLLARLADVREKGYAIELEEAYVGVRCVGAAVAVKGWPAVHISLSIPVQRASLERLHRLAKPLKEAAKEIEKILSLTPRI
jgi:IclR family acetate operon transcriptional repressor